MPATLLPEWLEFEKAVGGRSRLDGTPEEILKQFNALLGQLAPSMPPPDADVNREDKTVDGVPVRIYTPKGASGKLPVGIYTHGGGFVCGDLDSESALCDIISKAGQVVLVSVDYRLSPKVKHPAALEDTLKVFNWAYAHADELNGDKSKYFTIGASAGGGLALAVANKLVGDSSTRGQIKGVVGIVPLAIHPDNVPSEYKDQFKAYGENDDAPVINHSSMRAFYKAADAKPDDADNFVALSKNHAHFPPTYICVCGADPLRDDGIIIEKQLSKAGVKTKIDKYDQLPHYFHIFPPMAEHAQKFVGGILGGIGFVLS